MVDVKKEIKITDVLVDFEEHRQVMHKGRHMGKLIEILLTT